MWWATAAALLVCSSGSSSSSDGNGDGDGDGWWRMGHPMHPIPWQVEVLMCEVRCAVVDVLPVPYQARSTPLTSYRRPRQGKAWPYAPLAHPTHTFQLNPFELLEIFMFLLPSNSPSEWIVPVINHISQGD